MSNKVSKSTDNNLYKFTGSMSQDLIDTYIAGFPDDVQLQLFELRKIIHETVPEAREKMSYAMPTFYLNKNLIHFAAYKQHIGIYPGPEAIECFKEKLRKYKTSKGAIQFPLGKPLPIKLIQQILRFCVKQQAEKVTKQVR
jgi:uncharacterized protein YdhG (YjbR/CyaY superfamily)